ncbi:hypothetical protein AALO_G00107380 [Scomber scombrus]|uniref:BED-type domain-containing protein n=1 Tax=Scomber scombrus TaxID=13677 RepID=A0AAV1PN50_SCOSC
MSANSAIIKFAFMEHKEICSPGTRKKHSAKCKFCKVSLTETAGTTSTFTRHLERRHPESSALLSSTADVTGARQIEEEVGREMASMETSAVRRCNS